MAKNRSAKPRTFHITQAHCDSTCRRDAANCMIAKAIMDAIPSATHLMCTLGEIAWSNPLTGRRYKYFTPPNGAMAILKFDRGEAVKPFTLVLRNGVTFPMGWKPKHPGSTRKGRTYVKTGKTRMRYTKRRSFGASNISGAEAEAATSAAT